jgi:hypothetical protein
MIGKAVKGTARGALGTRTGRKTSGLGAKGAWKAGKGAGRAALKAGKAEAKLARRAFSSQEPTSSRLFKYGIFAFVGFAAGALWAKTSSSSNGTGSSYTGTTGHHSPDPGSTAGQRGETWGSGTPLGTAGGAGGGTAASSTAAEPLIGERRRPQTEMPEQQQEVEQRIRTRIGEDPRTMDMPRVNVEVNDGVAELRGEAPSDGVREAAGEIASTTEGVREVRNLISIK